MAKQEADITIDYIGRRGDGVGEWQGKPVFVPRVLPGELIHLQIGATRDKGHAGRLLDIKEKSTDRIAPPCPHYDQCGGCALQHWDDTAYRAWTQERVKELLHKNNLTPQEWKEPVFVPPHTRRRAHLAALLKSKKLYLGFHGARTHNIADIPDCMLLSPRLQNLTNAMRPYLMNILTDGKAADIFIQDTGIAIDVMITGLIGSRKEPQLKQREAMIAMAEECKISRVSWQFKERDEPETIVQYTPVTKQSGDLSVALPPGAFLQPSAQGEAALIAAVTAPLGEKLKIADLYAGCGTFSGPLLKHGHVHAVESDADAINALQKSARTANSNITTERRDLIDNPLTEKELKKFDAVIFDPPRAGAASQVEKLAASNVKTIIGISCNPATFARDAKTLCENGYILQSVQIIDQFTWSAHIEIAALFKKE